MPHASKRKIVILGGGLGGLATAFWLTEKPGWEHEYDICVYQMGWRLGGKCASARNVDRDYAKRIEEHGLHMFFGFYENAFLTLRRAFDELRALPTPPVATFARWDDAFKPHDLAILLDHYQDRWVRWAFAMPPRAGEPGTGSVPTPWEMVREMLAVLESLYRQFVIERLGVLTYPWLGTLPRCVAEPLETAVTAVQEALGWLLPGGAGTVGVDELLCELSTRHNVPGWCRELAEQPLDATHGRLDLTRARLLCAIADAQPDDAAALHASGVADLLADGIQAFRDVALAVLGPFRGSDHARLLSVILDLGCTTLTGMLRERILPDRFERLDDVDFRKWIEGYGARQETLDSRFLMAWYDMAFAFEGGDTSRPNAAAGTALLGMMRLLVGYKGRFGYKMQAGMGDTVCTPLYGILRARGVRFEFFHRVDRLVIDPKDPLTISEIQMTQQAELTPAAKAAGGYWPLIRVQDLDCWPSAPDLSQLVNGTQLGADPAYPFQLESNRAPWPGAPTVTLAHGTDFDTVVLAIPVGALDRICKELVQSDLGWRKMIEGDGATPPVSTVRTLAYQLWQQRLPPTEARERARAIWKNGYNPHRHHHALTSGFAEPFDTYSDMQQLLARETWPASKNVGELLYCCGPMQDAPGPEPTDPMYLIQQMELVRSDARAFLERHWRNLWPDFLTTPTRPVPWERVLVDPGSGSGDTFDRQFFRANVDPSDRYVGILAGTTRLRLAPDDSRFRNLVLAGDWVLNPVLSAGSAEPTCAAGMAAARAISGFPATIYGERR